MEDPIHKVSMNEKLKCEFCTKCFSHKQKMNQHVTLVHRGKKQFKCEICDYSSFHKGHVNEHLASVHGGKEPFKYEICKRSYFFLDT